MLDIESFSALLLDLVGRGRTLDDALRPVYIDYLERGPGS